MRAGHRLALEIYGFNPAAYIKLGLCVPPSIGCGKRASEFRDDSSKAEYQISGLCQVCQDKVFDEQAP